MNLSNYDNDMLSPRDIRRCWHKGIRYLAVGILPNLVLRAFCVNIRFKCYDNYYGNVI